MNNQRKGGNADLIAVGIVALLGAIGPRHASLMESGFSLAKLQWAELACREEPMRVLLSAFGG